MKTNTHHPESEDLESILLNRLSRAEEEAIEEHLLICERCRSITTSLEQQISLLREALSLA